MSLSYSVLLTSLDLLHEWVDIESLLSDWTLMWVLGTLHVEGHTVWEDPDLLEAKWLTAHLTLVVFSDDQVGTLQLLRLDLSIEYL